MSSAQPRGRFVLQGLFAAALTLLSLLFAGCGQDEAESLTARRLRGVASVYLDYAAARGNGPASQQILNDHLNSLPEFVREGYGFQGVDPQEAFTSLRDGQPFVIRYGIGLTGLSGEQATILAYEAQGNEAGRRLVVYLSTEVELIDEARLRELVGEAP
jgi:hypothetical protein